jgi:hypothetical protein
LDFANEEIPSPQAKAAPTIPPPTTQISACVAREEKCLIVRDFNIQRKKQKKMVTMKQMMQMINSIIKGRCTVKRNL